MDRLDRIVILANNQVGVIADITKILADAGINLESINTEATEEQGALILTHRQYRPRSVRAQPGWLQSSRRRGAGHPAAR